VTTRFAPTVSANTGQVPAIVPIVPVTAGPGDGLGDGDGVGEGLGLGVGEGLGLGAGDGDGEGLGLGDGEGLGLGVGDGVGEGLGLGVGDGEGFGVGDGVGDGLGPGDGDGPGADVDPEPVRSIRLANVWSGNTSPVTSTLSPLWSAPNDEVPPEASRNCVVPSPRTRAPLIVNWNAPLFPDRFSTVPESRVACED